MKCLEPAVKQEILAEQLSSLLAECAMPETWASKLEEMLTTDEKQANNASNVFVANAQTRISSLQGKLRRLLDGYLDQDIEQSVYRTKQNVLMSEKKSLEEQCAKLMLASNAWIEPMRQWIKQATSLCEIAKSSEPSVIKEAFLKIDGLNLILKNKQVHFRAPVALNYPHKTPCVALHASLQNLGKIKKSILLVREKGLEPSHLAAHAPKACVSTIPPLALKLLITGGIIGYLA